MTESARELKCMRCEAEHPVWYAPNDLWNKVVRRQDGSDTWPFLCPTCFAVLAAEAGVCTAFELRRAQTVDPLRALRFACGCIATNSRMVKICMDHRGSLARFLTAANDPLSHKAQDMRLQEETSSKLKGSNSVHHPKVHTTPGKDM